MHELSLAVASRDLSSSCGGRTSPVAEHWLQGMQASGVAAQELISGGSQALDRAGSAVVAHGLDAPRYVDTSKNRD